MKCIQVRKALRLIVFLFLVHATTAAAQPFVEGEEYKVKAAFLYNFIKFVEWPERSGSAPANTLNCCIIGKDPFGEHINLVRNQAAGNKKIQVIHHSHIRDLGNCHVLFISHSEAHSLEEIIQAVKGLPVLTVGDTQGYAQRGVIINMIVEAQKVRFEINLHASQLAGLKIDSRLLKLAKIVNGPD